MSDHQLSLLDAPKVAAVRKRDPRSSKRAAAENPHGRATQADRILRFLWRNRSTITADQAHRLLRLPGEDVTRGEWSARLGVLCSSKRGLLEHAGMVPEPDRHGRVREVLAYRLTPAGEEVAERKSRVVEAL